MRKRYFGHGCLLAALFAMPPGATFAGELSAIDAVALVRSDLQQALAPQGLPRAGEEPLLEAEALRAFYAQRDYLPAWTNDGAARPAARELLQRVIAAGEAGLDPQDYHRSALETLLAPAPVTPTRTLELELLLSDAYLHYAGDLYGGRIRQRQEGLEWNIERTPLPDLAALLRDALAKEDISGTLDSMEPPHPEYWALRHALARYTALARHGEWPELPPGPKLEPGDRDPRVPLLRRHMDMTGDLTPDLHPVQSDVYDPGLVEAVRRFQGRHGLLVDGVVGARTREALNVPLAGRVQQLALNMERWRWMPRQLEARRIQVNMVGFDLDVIDQRVVLMSMRVIVGQQVRSTPVFSSRITHVLFNPVWNVPPRIARQDILPKLQQEPEYLQRMNMEVMSNWTAAAEVVDPQNIDWVSLGTRMPYKLRQLPGPTNALGRLKFLLPNGYDIYLHDTPGRSLFQKPVRAFSSGCIRLEKPIELAEYLFRNEPGWDRNRILALITAGKTRTVRVPEPVPIYLLYLTAWIDRNGNVQFRDDIYGRDMLLADLLRQHGRNLAISM